MSEGPQSPVEKSLKLASMTAHKGACVVCRQADGSPGVVKMNRDDDCDLMPESCYCWHCGQWYHMDIPDIDAWERQQWEQKANSE